jgi:hypothetical protein
MLEGVNLGGCTSGHFNENLITQALATLPRFGRRAEVDCLFLTTAILAELKPRDPLEGMLIAQMIGVHAAAMESLRYANMDGRTFEAREMTLNGANKLLRSYAALLEALDRHRGKGQPQVVRVERVTVEAGAQAIVGAVSQGGGRDRETVEQSHAPGSVPAEPGPAMWRPNADREAVPVASDEGQTPVPDARRARRRTTRQPERLEARPASAEARAERRAFRQLLRETGELLSWMRGKLTKEGS